MATQKFSKFMWPESRRPGQITDRDLDILNAVLRLPILFGCAIGAPGGRQ
jgi:hypothetical protein